MQNKALTSKQVNQARIMEAERSDCICRAISLSRISIARRFNVSRETMAAIIAGETTFKKSSITKDEIKGILALYELGVAYKQSADLLSREYQAIKFNTCVRTIHRLHGKNSCYQ